MICLWRSAPHVTSALFKFGCILQTSLRMPSKRTYHQVEVTRKLRRRGPDVSVKAEDADADVHPQIKLEERVHIKKESFAASCVNETDSTSHPVTSNVDDPIIKVEISSNVAEFAEFDVEKELAIKKEDVMVKHEPIHQPIKMDPQELERLGLPSDSGKKLSTFPPNWFPSISKEDVNDSQPKDWDRIYNTVVEMRKMIVTPVDSMGCERMPDTITPRMSRDNAPLYRFQLLISLMLSSQTKDEVNHSAMVRLNVHFKEKGYDGLCLEACLDATEAELDECIKQVGFHRRKALYIKKTCEMLATKFGGELPKTIEEIVMFPGVGPKMGHLLLQNGWGINLGIGIDVHLHRLAQMWKWVPKSDKPEATRLALEDWLPRKYWADINPLLVGFGQTVCPPRALNCDVCTLATANLCKGVNRKLANTDITDARMAKLAKQRGDLLQLAELRRAAAKIL